MSILVIAELNQGNLDANTLNVISAAKEIGGAISVLVAGNNIGEATKQASQIKGVTQVFSVDDESLAYYVAENMAALGVNLVQEYNFSHVLAAATSIGKDYLPRLAALLDCEQISEITTIIDEHTFVRPIYAGNILATVHSSAAIKVISVRVTAFNPGEHSGGNAEVISYEGNFAQDKSVFIGQQFHDFDYPELTVAKVIIGGGRGLQSRDKFNILFDVADKLGGAVGATRAAVDAGFIANDFQIGQTGKIVAPDLYIAVGISGAIQHVAGIKDAKIIVAINKDADAPIFQIADFYLEADLFDAIPELISKL